MSLLVPNMRDDAERQLAQRHAGTPAQLSEKLRILRDSRAILAHSDGVDKVHALAVDARLADAAKGAPTFDPSKVDTKDPKSVCNALAEAAGVDLKTLLAGMASNAQAVIDAATPKTKAPTAARRS